MLRVFLASLVTTSVFGASFDVVVTDASDDRRRLDASLRVVYEFGDERVFMSVSDDDNKEFEDDEVTVCATIESQSTRREDLWGLDRFDSHCDVPDDTYEYFSYQGEEDPVTVYVIDTGTSDHDDLGGRVIGGTRIIYYDPTTSYEDDNGHGTHVASLIAGDTYGSCKSDCNIYSIKAIDNTGSGTMSDIVESVYHAVNDTMYRGGKSMINMSLMGGLNQALNDAVAFARSHGMIVVVAAGNENMNACVFSPASSSDAWTVGSTDPGDVRSYYSNYGDCVDFFAPGSRIRGSDKDGGSVLKSGTSMSSPLAAGLIAKKWLEYSDLDNEELIPYIRHMIRTSPVTTLDVMNNPVNSTSPSTSTSTFTGCLRVRASTTSSTGRRFPGVLVRVGAKGGGGGGGKTEPAPCDADSVEITMGVRNVFFRVGDGVRSMNPTKKNLKSGKRGDGTYDFQIMYDGSVISVVNQHGTIFEQRYHGSLETYDVMGRLGTDLTSIETINC